MKEREWEYILYLTTLSLFCFFTLPFLFMATSHSQQGDYLFLWVDLLLSVGIWENGNQNDRMSTHWNTQFLRHIYKQVAVQTSAI